MKKVLIGALVAVAAACLAACDTTSAVGPYTASTPNVLAIQSVMKPNGLTAKVGDFTATAIERPMCRLAGALDVTSGKPFEQYIKDAFQTELFTAQVYDVNSTTTISGHLDEMKVNTFGTGSWTLGLQVTSNHDPVGYHVQVVRPYSSSYSAVVACQNATNAFAPTVQELIAQVISNPGFGKLMGR